MLIKLTDISAAYNKDIVLSKVNLTVNKGDFVGIIGPNGGGKTTLLKIILGLIKPVSGRIEYAENLNIGYLPQQNDSDTLFPISVEDVVFSGLMGTGFSTKQKPVNNFNKLKKKYSNDCEELLTKMQIADIRHKSLGELSGGQRQKTLLCRALISKPDLLLLDEPNTYIDKNSEFELYKYLDEMSDVSSFLLVSHDIGSITNHIKTIACVNKELYYHESNIITEEVLSAYNCPIRLITHGTIPHTILKDHNHD